MLLTTALLLVVASQVHGHSYHMGECPTVKPMENFDMNKFLGKWYVIQKTSTGSACLINTYSKDEKKPGQYKIEQISEHVLLGKTSSDHKYHYTGELTIPDPKKAAEMKVQFQLNIGGGSSYTVFTTDYDTYAGLFSCQKLGFSHRRSSTIISRTKTLDKQYLDKIRDQLSSFGIDPYDLSIIRQDNCTEGTEHATNDKIDNRTFSTGSVAEVFRKAGEKIGDGIETIVDSVKKVYTNYRGDHGESKEEFLDKRNMKEDAEWLP